ncbi:hypothetical protein BGZ72_001859, partial [Mortierella alpina]
MEETQPFRLIGSEDILEILVNSVGGQNFVYWEDIEQVFPGVKHVQKGKVAIIMLRDSDGNRIVPHHIKYYPGVVLDVVLSAVEHAHVGSPRANSPASGQFSAIPDNTTTTPHVHAPANPATANTYVSSSIKVPLHPAVDESLSTTESNVVSVLQVISEATASNTLATTVPASLLATSKTCLSFRQVAKLAMKQVMESDIQQRLISSLAPEVQTQVLASSGIYCSFIQAIKDGQVEQADRLSKDFNECYQDLKSEMEKNTKLTAHTAEQADRLIELQAELHVMQEKMEQLQIQALGQLAVLQSRVQAVLTQTYELHEYPIPRLFIVLPQYPSGWDILEPFTEKYRLYFLCECGEHTKAAGSNSKIPHKIHLAKHEGYEIARPTDFFQQYGPYVLTMLKMLKFGVSVASVAVPAVAHLINADALDHAAKGLQHLKDCIELGMDQMISKIEKDSVDEIEPVENFTDQVENKEALEGADLRKLETFLKGKDGNRVLGNLYRTVTDQGHVKWVCMDHYRENYNIKAAEAFRLNLQSRVLSEQFYSGLQKARSVHVLDINLDFEGVKSDLEALADVLKTSNVSILHLHLRQFRTSLSSKLRSLSLDLYARKVGAKSVGVLFETLKTNLTLTALDLQLNAIGSDGAKALAEALKANSTLTTLNLYNNLIGSDGAKTLAEVLKTNKTLTTLHLRYNSIGSDGVKALAEALKTNSTVATLDLEDNSIGDDGAKALAETLKTNKTLTTLYLQNTSTGSDGAKALVEALKTNKTLTN